MGNESLVERLALEFRPKHPFFEIKPERNNYRALLRTISEDQNNETAKLILDLDIYTDTA
jgi:hypothetical protein